MSQVQSAGPSSNLASIPNNTPEPLAGGHGPHQHSTGGAQSNPPDGMQFLPSLAASVADRVPLHVRPTSTQEGTETPVIPSDDDTIEMLAGGSDRRARGGSHRGRRTGSSVAGTAAALMNTNVPTDEPAAPDATAQRAEAPRPVQLAPQVSPPTQREHRHSCSSDEGPGHQQSGARWQSALREQLRRTSCRSIPTGLQRAFAQPEPMVQAA